MPRWIRAFPLHYLRRLVTIGDRSAWELMAALAYVYPVALFDHDEPSAPQPACDDRERRVQPAYQADHADAEVRLTEHERRIWGQLCQELSR